MSIGTRVNAFEKGNKAKKRPDFITDEHLQFLDNMRASGATNMLRAVSYIDQEFPNLTQEQSREILGYWMKSFGKPTR